jgi:hypothetical protein
LHIPSTFPTRQASTDGELARVSRNSAVISFLNSDSDSGWLHILSVVSRGHAKACWTAGRARSSRHYRSRSTASDAEPVRSPTLLPLILSPNRCERNGRGDILARSQGRHTWRRTRIHNSPEFVSSVDVGDKAGMDGCDRQPAVDDCRKGSSGKPSPAKEPHMCHFYLLDQVNFENRWVA